MTDNEIILAVVDDPGIQDWLGRVVEAPFRLEFVGRADLSRVVRMLEATTAHMVLVEANEVELDQSLAIITALTSARPWVTVITVCTRTNQDDLLQCMRAGARDCFMAGNDVGEIRDRLRRHQLVRSGHYGDENRSTTSNLTLITAADISVDTRFLSQNLALGMTLRNPGQRVLAIDTQASERGVFYLDASHEFTLQHLLASPETLDENLVDTALDEFRPGLRLLAGGAGALQLDGNHSADLFIALNRLMQMFDHIIVNVALLQSNHWVRALGIHARHFLIAMHPLVQQAHTTRHLVQDWRSHLGRDGRIALVVDGYDSGVPPGPAELSETVGVEVAGKLPMDWRQRLLAINSSQLIQEQAPGGVYSRSLDSLLDYLEGPQSRSKQGLIARLMAR